MRGQDMQEQIWAIAADEVSDRGYWGLFNTAKRNIQYTRTDLCITEAECQRRIDAAVLAEREACAGVPEASAENLEAQAKRFVAWSDPHYYRTNVAETHRKMAAAIRARGQK